MPAAQGFVRLLSKLPRDAGLLRTCVLRGASRERLCGRLRLDSVSDVSAYLAATGVLVVFGQRGTRDVVLHAAAPRSLRRYAAGLRRASATLRESGARDLIPRVIDTFDCGADRVLVQARAVGCRLAPEELDDDRLEAVFVAGLQPLRALHDRPAAGYLQAEEGRLRRMQHLFDRSGVGAPLSDIVTKLYSWEARRGLRAVLVHGDYILPNLLFHEDRVSAVLDWEWYRPRGCAGFDAVKFAVTTYANSRGIDQLEVLGSILRNAAGEHLERLLTHVQSTFALSRDDVAHLGMLHWLDQLADRVRKSRAFGATERQSWIDDPAHLARQWLGGPTEADREGGV